MKKVLFVLVLVVACLAGKSVSANEVSAARGVLNRFVGSRANDFILQLIPKESGLDVYQVRAEKGRVYVSGSSGVTICRGAYDYLRKDCNCLFSWEGSSIHLPKVFPDSAERRVLCPNKLRHYFNVCTFGYTTVWWDWNRWQREIDWMALHGINAPLAMNGQEGIWQRVWKKYGLSDKDLREFFPGPAFLPWFRMGNQYAHEGPLPQHWMDSQMALQKRILASERSLGMTPILPAFSSFVPPAFAKKHPEAKVRESSGWCGFPPTILLDPTDPLFIRIGADFIHEMSKEFGTDHLYLADVYNEMNPVVQPETKMADLAQSGESIYKSILAGDPKGTWVMQGWLFYCSRDFWQQDETASYLIKIPNDRMIILDLSADAYEVWRHHQSVRDKNWIYCTLHNYGQRTPINGRLDTMAVRPAAALNDHNHGKMAGMGLTMEGIEQNPVVYELCVDTMWSDKPIDLSTWIHDYCRDRYGNCPPAIDEAWKIILQTVYSSSNNEGLGSYTVTPTTEPRWSPAGYDLSKLRQAIDLMLSCEGELGESALYRRDLVDFTKSYMSQYAGRKEREIISAYKSGDVEMVTVEGRRYIRMLHKTDELLATRPEYRFSTYVSAARGHGISKEESDLYEKNARTLLTVWGMDLIDSDYACKEWSGMMSGYYIPRWEQFIAMLHDSAAKHQPEDPQWKKRIGDWSWSWTKELGGLEEPKMTDEVSAVRNLLSAYK